MDRQRVGAFLVGLGTTVVLAVFALSATFSVLLTPLPTHVFSYVYADGSVSGLSQDDMAQVADGILKYSLGQDDAGLPVGTDYRTSITEDDLAHLRDCRGLFLGVVKLAVVSGVLGVVAVAALLLSHRRRLLGRSLIAATMGVVVLLAAGVGFALYDFSIFFNFLHTFFFTSGSWLFPATSLMICALPEPFWTAMGVLWVVLLAAVCVIYVVLGRRCQRQNAS